MMEYVETLTNVPNDGDNDIDGDGVCGDIDECPYDGDNDIDGDGSMW